jgi:Family of unknown function (DUF6173)
MELLSMNQPNVRRLDLIQQGPSQSVMDSITAMNRAVAEQKRRENQAIDSTNFLAELQRANFANEFAERLISRINHFDAELDTEHEVGMKLVSFGQTITFHVSDVGYYNPSLVLFIGLTEDNNRVELLQHVSQISFLLIALPKLNPEQPKRTIGFIREIA